VQDALYRDFLFPEFLVKFSSTFSFPNFDSKFKNSFYNWNDFAYRKFMIEILSVLEPRKEEKNLILFEELDEVNEMIFF
jgi:hypothetical protein